ncbi:hypothetical protein C4B63_94g45 [Trypanosoma cruzi]|nr:hypothetical protein C4B63_94g45 [Trypanosoma cruzi]
MEFLSQLYNDDAYRDYLDANPSFSLAVLSRKNLRIAEGLSYFFDSRVRFRINYFSDVKSFLNKGVDVNLSAEISGILKSNWCSKHLRFRCSCVLVCLDWDQLGETAIDEVWLSGVCSQLKEYMRSFRSKVIIALVTENTMRTSANSTAQIEKLQYDLKIFFGSDFKNFLPLYESGMGKESAEKLFQMAVGLATKYHKDEMSRLKNSKLEPSYPLVRRGFKLGWHCLVLNDTKNAQKHFENAYRTLRKIAPFWPAMELRICGTILLFRVLHIVALESAISSDDMYCRLCEDHIMWIGRAIPCGSPEFKPMARFLRLILVGECYEWLLRNCRYVADETRRDYLFAAMGAFEEAIKLNQPSGSSKRHTTAPVFVGTECHLESHNCIFYSNNSMRTLSVRVKDLLSEIESHNSLSLDAFYVSVGVHASFHAWEQVFVCLEKFGGIRIGTYKEAEAVHKIWMCAMQSTGGNLKENIQEDVLFSYVSLCFGPAVGMEQKNYMKQFTELMKQNKLNHFSLSYPRRGHFAPFTILCRFQDEHHVCATKTEIHISLFTASIEMIIVDSLYVVVSWLSSDGVEDLSTYLVSDKGLKLSLNTPSSASLTLVLDKPGTYHCRSVRGRVNCAGIQLNVEWKLEKSLGGNTFLRGTEILPSISGLLYHKPWISVVRPVCGVDIEVPRSIAGIEGEEVNVDIVVKSEQDLTGNGTLVIHDVPSLYEFFWDACQEKKMKMGEGLRKGYRTVILDNIAFISCDHPLYVTLNYRCLRAGKYMVPILFYYKSGNYSDVEILKRIQLNVFYPFSTTYTFLKVLPWMVTPIKGDVIVGSENTLRVPEFSRVSIQHERFTLVHPRYSARDDVSTIQSNRDSLVYIAHTEREDHSDNFASSRGEEIILLVSMECRAPQGLMVKNLDVVCTQDASLSSVVVSLLPCHVEHLEVLTLSIKFRLLNAGKISLGFIRMILAPGNGAQHIISDFPLPEVKVEDTPFVLSLRGPSIAIIGSPIFISFDITNKTENFQNCELLVEKNNGCFLMNGRTQWSFCLAPNTFKSTEIILQPICIGTIKLPSVYLRHSTGLASGKCAVCVSDSQMICVLPS